MKPSFAVMAILLLAASAASRAQVVPAAIVPASTGEWSGLPVSGALHYDVRYSQTAQFGGSQDGQQMSYISGDASYANTGKRLPFSMQYGGGYGWVWAGPPSAGNVYQHLSLSQGIVGRTWNLIGQRRCTSYSFETPTTGFSGVPGIGEPIGGSGHANLAGPDDPDGEYPLDRQLYDARVRT
jgi:opacity protein-like surface antigen